MRIAIIENDQVANVISAEDLPAIRQLFSHHTVVQESDVTYLAWIGARWNGVRFESPKPFNSWNWNEETFEYDPPLHKPKGAYYWDESKLDWQLMLGEAEFEAKMFRENPDYQGRPDFSASPTETDTAT
jgi:hypothetical protein